MCIFRSTPPTEVEMLPRNLCNLISQCQLMNFFILSRQTQHLNILCSFIYVSTHVSKFVFTAIIMQVHKNLNGKLCNGRSPSFTVNMIKHINLFIIPNKGILYTWLYVKGKNSQELYLQNKVSSWYYLCFHSGDFPEIPHL